MIEHITPIDDLYKEIKEIDEYLTVECSDDINEIQERGFALSVYIARTGKMLADAKYHMRKRNRSEVFGIIEQLLEFKPSAKIQNSLVEAMSIEEAYLVDWVERTNRTCVHQLDWCRTVMSKEKEMIKYGMQ